tara:strand:+ start:130 stop:501 length:372 start_codon:yes stop_codon:yes gene_type:complete
MVKYFSALRNEEIEFVLKDIDASPQQWAIVKMINNQAKQMFWEYRQMLLDSIRVYDNNLDQIKERLISSDSFTWWVENFLPSSRAIQVGMFGEEHVSRAEEQLAETFDALGIKPREPVPFSRR